MKTCMLLFRHQILFKLDRHVIGMYFGHNNTICIAISDWYIRECQLRVRVLQRSSFLSALNGIFCCCLNC
jgi:hypothetical protein